MPHLFVVGRLDFCTLCVFDEQDSSICLERSRLGPQHMLRAYGPSIWQED